jgi:two-component system NarL family sensor kinase
MTQVASGATAVDRAAARPWTVRVTAGAVVAVVVALSAVTLLLSVANGVSPARFLDGNQANGWVAGLASGVLAGLIMYAQPHNRLWVVFTIEGLLVSASVAANSYVEFTAHTAHRPLPGLAWAAWCSGTWWVPGMLIQVGAVPMFFPDGRIRSPAWRWPARILVAAFAAGSLLALTTQALMPPGFTNPFDLPSADRLEMIALAVCSAVAFIGGLGATVDLVVSMRSVDGVQRRRHAWFLISCVLTALFVLAPLPEFARFALMVLATAAVGVGIVWYGLYDIEPLLSRTIAYTVLTSAAVGAYLVVTVTVGARLSGGVVPAAAAAVVAIILAGFRLRVQRRVEWLLYGERRDPLAALTSLGTRLSTALDAEAVLPAVVETVRESLRMPYAAIQLAGDDQVTVESGRPVGTCNRFPVLHAGQPVGTLIVGTRRGETHLNAADTRVLQAFARQAGVAIHDVGVTRELRHAREALVLAREEERRRIRRDLHDGLGPALAGISLGLEGATQRVRPTTSDVGDLLDSLRAETAKCVDEVKRIVNDLHPAALDEIGLLAALHQHVELIASRTDGLHIDLQADQLPTLPAAVEAAAYRIGLEALTNVVRHSHAEHCRLELRMNGTLQLSITDNGVGLPGGSERRGMGLTSMSVRAEELGGNCTVTSRDGGGTVVAVTLPVGRPWTP